MIKCNVASVTMGVVSNSGFGLLSVVTITLAKQSLTVDGIFFRRNDIGII